MLRLADAERNVSGRHRHRRRADRRVVAAHVHGALLRLGAAPGAHVPHDCGGSGGSPFSYGGSPRFPVDPVPAEVVVSREVAWPTTNPLSVLPSTTPAPPGGGELLDFDCFDLLPNSF